MTIDDFVADAVRATCAGVAIVLTLDVDHSVEI